MAGTLLAATGQRVLLAHPPGGAARWERPNHRGSRVSLLSGPTLVAMAALTSGLPALPAAVAALGAAGTGLYDDAAGHRDRAKGLRGHAAALRAGRVTGGAVKVLGIGASSLTAVLLLPRRSAVAVVRDAALVAGTANLLNLLDLRPGRALKAGLAAAAALHLPGPAGVCVALLPADLGERTMLGDCGANGLGAVLGLAAVVRLAPGPRSVLLAAVTVLTATSEVVSFTRVIEATPGLRELDGLGRRR